MVSLIKDQLGVLVGIVLGDGVVGTWIIGFIQFHSVAIFWLDPLCKKIRTTFVDDEDTHRVCFFGFLAISQSGMEDPQKDEEGQPTLASPYH